MQSLRSPTSTFDVVRIAQSAFGEYSPSTGGESTSQVVSLATAVPHGPLCTVHLARPLSKSSLKRLMLCGRADRIPTPGAARSTDVAPRLEKLASLSVSVVAATHSRFVA